MNAVFEKIIYLNKGVHFTLVFWTVTKKLNFCLFVDNLSYRLACRQKRKLFCFSYFSNNIKGFSKLFKTNLNSIYFLCTVIMV